MFTSNWGLPRISWVLTQPRGICPGSIPNLWWLKQPAFVWKEKTKIFLWNSPFFLTREQAYSAKKVSNEQQCNGIYIYKYLWDVMNIYEYLWPEAIMKNMLSLHVSFWESQFLFHPQSFPKNSRTQPEDSGNLGLRIGSLGTIFPRQLETVKHNTNQKTSGCCKDCKRPHDFSVKFWFSCFHWD